MIKSVPQAVTTCNVINYLYSETKYFCGTIQLIMLLSFIKKTAIRVFAYELGGREFESLRARQIQ